MLAPGVIKSPASLCDDAANVPLSMVGSLTGSHRLEMTSRQQRHGVLLTFLDAILYDLYALKDT